MEQVIVNTDEKVIYGQSFSFLKMEKVEIRPIAFYILLVILRFVTYNSLHHTDYFLILFYRLFLVRKWAM